MWQMVALTFLAGVFAANATPHFVKGITKEHFPTVFGSGPLVNVVVGWTGYVIAGLLFSVSRAGTHPRLAFAAVSFGVLVMAVFHAWVGAFGKRTAVRS
ncbi:hypothetical protein [Phytomonospora endophytica]|uniref:Putative membrane protein YeaQ/YmgE (Transglycosylase-associated protein family) n=1 Tax=Phytomonospora endophytica TaxID=714109 RepID=A0A841FS19_9ACTN|nr:hypothetical protein [Phytomonospora endophytica]MBB6034760.1 putative membrane protein YeaQ/YmgE (transglycosylase-associated protein family) [Phytomonospora endophytica]GIG69037.1 hypothetical protein Pen01_53320 [Phytomonospora endophytica]